MPLAFQHLTPIHPPDAKAAPLASENPAAPDPNVDSLVPVAFNAHFVDAWARLDPMSASSRRLCVAYIVVVLHEAVRYFRWLFARERTPRNYHGIDAASNFVKYLVHARTHERDC